MTNHEKKTHSVHFESKHRAYDEYEPVSGDWTDTSPAHWEEGLIKRRFKVQVGKMLQSSPNSPSDIKLPYLKARHIQQNGDFDLEDLPRMWFSPDDRTKYSLRRGDVLVAEGGDVGRAGVWEGTDEEILYQNAINRLRGKGDDSPRFLYYWINHLKTNGYIEVLCSSATIHHYTAEKVKTTPFLIPPIEEQQTIADFLDLYTALIDQLIEKKQRLLKLLKEKRQSYLDELRQQLISDDNVKLKYLVDSLPGFAFESGYFSKNSSDIRLLRGVNVGVGEIRWDDVEYWPRDEMAKFSKYLLEPGDIVLGMDRPWINEGIRVAQVDESDCPALLVQRVLRIRTKAGIHQDYVRMALESDRFRQYFEPITTGVSVPHISKKQVGEFEIPVPPESRQESLLAQWRAFKGEADRLREATRSSIELLQEKRQALITNAVTGQIDLSDWELPDEQEAPP